jgi:flagellar biosynthesis/type III secretory pathway protein FliH
MQQAIDSTQAVVEEFKRKKAIVDTVLMIAKQLLACIFVRIIFQ